MLTIPAIPIGLIVLERSIEWDFTCDYTTSYEVTDVANMAPATTVQPSVARNANDFHSNGFYDVTLRNVSNSSGISQGSQDRGIVQKRTNLKQASFFESDKYETKTEVKH